MGRGRGGWRWVADVLRVVVADRLILLLVLAALAVCVLVFAVVSR